MKLQERAINNHKEFKEYRDAFCYLFSSAYNAAQIAKDSNIALDADGGIIVRGISSAISSIPLCGSVLSEIFQFTTKKYNEYNIKTHATKLLKISPTQSALEDFIKNVSREIVMNPRKQQELLNLTENTVEKHTNSFIKNIISKISETGHKALDKLNGGNLDITIYAKQGIIEATKALEQFITYSETHITTSFVHYGTTESIIKKALIQEEEKAAAPIASSTEALEALQSQLELNIMGADNIIETYV
jgi:hypothetical protein